MAIMEDGFSTTIDFGQAGTVFHAKTVTPPALISGGPNNVTSMENTTYRTKTSKKLIDVGDITAVGFYDPSVYSSFISLLGVNAEITITFPMEEGGLTAATLVIWGWLDELTPSAHEEGSAPEATVKIVVSNRNDSGVETAPVFTAGT